MRSDAGDVLDGRSTTVDQAWRPPGSRVPLRTPIGERDADLRDEHPAEARVQLRAPRSSEGSRAFARSPLNGTPDLAEAARSRSHYQSRRFCRRLGLLEAPSMTSAGLSRVRPRFRGQLRISPLAPLHLDDRC